MSLLSLQLAQTLEMCEQEWSDKVGDAITWWLAGGPGYFLATTRLHGAQ